MTICSICECITSVEDLNYCDECDALHCIQCFTPITNDDMIVTFTHKEGESDG